MRSSVACALSLGLLASASGANDEITLPELMGRIAAAEGVTADFHDTKEIALLAQPLESSGVLYFAPPGRLARFTLEPGVSSLIVNGDSLRFRDGDGESYDLGDNPMARVFVENFIVLFDGDVERLEAAYRTELHSDGERWTLRLEPRRAPLDALVLDFVIRGTRRGIEQMVMRSADGDVTTTELRARERHGPFSESELESLFERGVPLSEAP